MRAFPFHTREATRADIPALTALIEASVRGIGPRRYNPQQVESSLTHLFGVDSQLIEDGTYYVVETDGTIVGCGGWSRRRTSFGGDQATAVQDTGLRDPTTDSAVIRAFFVHPDWTRRGIGRRLLKHCEAAAREEGFCRYELVASLTGLPLYTAMGFREVEPIEIELPDGIMMQAVKMIKP